MPKSRDTYRRLEEGDTEGVIRTKFESLHGLDDSTDDSRRTSLQSKHDSFASIIGGDLGLAGKASAARKQTHSTLTSKLLYNYVKSRGEEWKPSSGTSHCGQRLADSYESAILYGLAASLLRYGAPIYRVERRVLDAAIGVGLTTSVMCQPNQMLITFGEGTLQHPTRTFFTKIPASMNMGKLQEVDEIARRCCRLVRLRSVGETTSKQVSHPAEFPLEVEIEGTEETRRSEEPNGGADDAAVYGRQPAEPPHRLSTKSPTLDAWDEESVTGESPSQGTAKPRTEQHRPSSGHKRLHAGDSLTSAKELPRQGSNGGDPPSRPAHIDDEITSILHTLDEVITRPPHHPILRGILTNAVSATCICMLSFYGTPGDALCALVIGALAGAMIQIGDRVSSQGVAELLVALVVSACARIAERLWPGNWPLVFAPGQAAYANETAPASVWATVPFMTANATETGAGSVGQAAWYDGIHVCHNSFVVGCMVQLLPGLQITLGMLELSSSPVSGSVRMFQSFIRSLKLGYGINMGSKLGVWILETLLDVDRAEWALLQDGLGPQCPQLPTSTSLLTDLSSLWRIAFFVPLHVSQLIQFRSNRKQWVPMTVASLSCFVTFYLARMEFSPDIASAAAAFVLAIVANMWALSKNDVAIASIVAGVSWLVPGQLAVRSATQALAFDTAASSGGTTFGIGMILRAMAIAIGIYMANIAVHPISSNFEDKILTI
ncbi:hypothetical protein DFJ73DRAFT_948833 [Zopfochytrium polystomum]|nr:hypothetical protein DFJ73DRAFT_948833 [Zopfochytrium polystomum]